RSSPTSGRRGAHGIPCAFTCWRTGPGSRLRTRPPRPPWAAGGSGWPTTRPARPWRGPGPPPPPATPPPAGRGPPTPRTPVLLRALAITHTDSSLVLQTDRGAVTLHPQVNGKGDVSWSQYGEIGGPPGSRLVTAFGGRTADAYRRDPSTNLDLPLHLRGRRA